MLNPSLNYSVKSFNFKSRRGPITVDPSTIARIVNFCCIHAVGSAAEVYILEVDASIQSVASELLCTTDGQSIVCY